MVRRGAGTGRKYGRARCRPFFHPIPAVVAIFTMRPMPHTTPSQAAGPGRPTTSPRSRIPALDVLRGFALCGILIANVKPIAHMVEDVPVAQAVAADSQDGAWMGLLVDQRFFPIFSVLFGIGFSLLLDSARARVPSPRLLLLRRLLVLLAIGLAHMFLLWRGDILTIYAVVGLVVLLPSTWLPRWAVAVLAAVLIATPLVLGSNGVPLVPGLFLLGSALTRYGVVDRIERPTLVPAALGLGLAVAAVPALLVQARDPESNTAFAIAGLLLAGVYVCALLLLLRTSLRRALHAVFAPLGRMALTNYLSATVLVLVLVLAVSGVAGGTPDEWTLATVLLIAAAVLVPQWLVSTLWLRRYRHGPMEWLWRWATWAWRPSPSAGGA